MQAKPTPIDAEDVRFSKHILTLTESQATFAKLVAAWSRDPKKSLLIVSGGPGTGKSHVVKKTLDFLMTEQCRLSYTARSAQAIGGQTIHSALRLNFRGRCQELEKELENEMDLVTSIKASEDILKEFTYTKNPYVVMVDEVSMINAWLMYWIIRFFMDRTDLPLLFITIGDPHQLNPVKCAYNLFSIDFRRKEWLIQKVHLKENKRFTPEYGDMIETLRSFVDSDDEPGLFAFLCEHFPVCDSIEGTQLKQANRAMAAKNDRVNTFNAYYIKNMVKGPAIEIQSKLVLKPGCIVMVTKNGCSSVKNGTELKFIRFCKYTERVICTDPKTKEEVSVRKDSESNKFPLALGFAATIHKFQGDTIDNAKIVIHFDGNRNLNLAYTALSRVRRKDQILAIAL